MNWVWVVVITWLALALVVSLLVGRAIRRAEETERRLRRKVRPVPRPPRQGSTISTSSGLSARAAAAGDRRRQRTAGRSRHP